jgi:hypothetical protein
MSQNIKVRNTNNKQAMKISQLCKMIEDSIHDGNYQLEDQQKDFIDSVQVINRSDSDDLKSSEIKIEVRIHDLYTISNYLPNMQHLPGVIEIDILDSFKMLCRRLGRITNSSGDNPKGTTISTDKLHLSG